MVLTQSYAEDQERLRAFLRDFEEEDYDGEVKRKYVERLQVVANRASRTVEVELEDIANGADDGEALCERISSNARRYMEVIASAIDAVLPPATEYVGSDDAHDVMYNLREERMRQERSSRQPEAEDGSEPGGAGVAEGGAKEGELSFPPELLRRYQIRLVPRDGVKVVPLRLVLSAQIGRLVSVKGIVTRVTAVRPQLKVATYTCEACGHEVHEEVTARTFKPLDQCPSRSCKENRTNGKLRMQTRGSKFVPFQELRLQEEADQVPGGHIPRAITVHAYGEVSRACSAGDIVTVTGIFLPTPYEGRNQQRAGLLADTYLEAVAIDKTLKGNADAEIDHSLQEKVAELNAEADVYERLSQSIAPEIFAHEDVKKALLLLLVGGVTNVMEDGMRIRGDINICLMGDPGVAKSQLLKHVKQIAPRCVYTTGKGSSGVGLTAAVTRDQTTGEFVLEGGALVLADMGICCIDEFDKMEDSDRTAIHEVMEQQTVSIAKAGITTTLNARTSVLAAANHAYSRYNPSKSVAENINMPAALLSRFDLMWLIRDKPDLARDRALAEHVTHVHTFCHHPELGFEAEDSVHGEREEKTHLSPQDKADRIAALVNDLIAGNGGDFIKISDVMPQLIAMGCSPEDLERTIDEYENLAVWTRINDGNTIKLIDPDMD
ncbi:mini-chromosome maintenance [Pavlovales sp. CCMP2436]|nr:mini-chromosome maintenance [Pavlovales sp. CCMP2436]